MLIFVYGDDTFRVQEKVGQMKDAFIAKFDSGRMNTDVFPAEGRKLDAGEVLQAACSFPFLGEKRMVIVRDVIGTVKADEAKVWEEGLARAPESTIVVFWETDSPKAIERKGLFKKLSAAADVHTYPFPLLEGAGLTRWVQARVKHAGGAITFDAVRGLVERVGADLWQMSHEIEKLVAYAGGKEITPAMVEELVRASFEGQIFAMIDAVSRRRPEEALRLLRQERWSGANDFYLMTMLSRQIRILIGARALLDENPYADKRDLADTMAVHPFVAQKALAQAKAFRLEDLKRTHDLLFEFDQGMKSGRIKADLAVDLVAVALLQ